MSYVFSKIGNHIVTSFLAFIIAHIVLRVNRIFLFGSFCFPFGMFEENIHVKHTAIFIIFNHSVIVPDDIFNGLRSVSMILLLFFCGDYTICISKNLFLQPYKNVYYDYFLYYRYIVDSRVRILFKVFGKNI